MAEEQFTVKRISELPDASYAGTSYVPIDDGTTTGKLALKDIVPDGSTSDKGIVQLEDSHTSTSTSTAATPKNVKEAYDLANTKAASTAIAPNFDSTVLYTKNVLVMYNNALYRFKTNHMGPWNASDVDAVNVAQLLKEQDMKEFTIWASTGVSYELTGNARSASFSPSTAEVLETYAISSMNNNIALLDGTKDAKIVGARVKAGGGFGLQPASGEKAANLVLELIAVASDGTTVGNAVATYNVQVLNWGSWEDKYIELNLPATIPSGAVGFGFQMSTTTDFGCDDFNIQTDYVGEDIVPEVLLCIQTDSMVEMATGNTIN